jgi:hypothetical protein
LYPYSILETIKNSGVGLSPQRKSVLSYLSALGTALFLCLLRLDLIINRAISLLGDRIATTTTAVPMMDPIEILSQPLRFRGGLTAPK